MDVNILQQLTEAGHTKEIKYYEQIDSTNLRAKLEVRDYKGVVLPKLYVTDMQTQGRGRMGRSWSDKDGYNIAMSYLFKPDLTADKISGVTLLSSLAVTYAVMEYCNDHGLDIPDVKIKWPNDVVINGRKTCGILTELVAPQFVICGIGINVNTPSFPEELSDKATSLLIETSHIWSREELICKVISNLATLIKSYEAHNSLGFIKDKYNNLLVSRDKEVILNTYNPVDESVSGDLTSSHKSDPSNKQSIYISRGIDENGALLVEDSAGIIKAISSGEVSVRGVYGYV